MTKAFDVLRMMNELEYLFPDEKKALDYIKKSLPGFAKLFKSDNDLQSFISDLGSGEDLRLLKKRYSISDVYLRELLTLQKMLNRG